MFKIYLLILVVFSVQTLAASDPTKPFSGYSKIAKGKQQAGLVLKSIIHGEGVRTVIINNKVMKVGDNIGEYKLIAVNNNSVILRSDEGRKKLSLFSSAITK